MHFQQIINYSILKTDYKANVYHKFNTSRLIKNR